MIPMKSPLVKVKGSPFTGLSDISISLPLVGRSGMPLALSVKPLVKDWSLTLFGVQSLKIGACGFVRSAIGIISLEN